MFPFFLKTQVDHLKKRISLIKGLKKQYEVPLTDEDRLKLNSLGLADKCFRSRTTSWIGRLQSFIPGTQAFSYRFILARRLDEAHHIVDKIETLLIYAKVEARRGAAIRPIDAIGYDFEGNKIYPSPIAIHRTIGSKATAIQTNAQPVYNVRVVNF